MGLSAAGAAAAALGWALLVPRLAAPEASSLALGAAALLPPAAVLAAMILSQMLVRFATLAVDPTVGADGRALLIGQRVIANSVEQLAVFAPALLALAASGAASGAEMFALGIVFALARLVFWAGYALHPLARAPGMGATALVCLGTLCWAGLGWWRAP
ncbi:MAG: MAPEG family protein [Acetobacteraceae bacterium]